MHVMKISIDWNKFKNEELIVVQKIKDLERQAIFKTKEN